MIFQRKNIPIFIFLFLFIVNYFFENDIDVIYQASHLTFFIVILLQLIFFLSFGIYFFKSTYNSFEWIKAIFIYSILSLTLFIYSSLVFNNLVNLYMKSSLKIISKEINIHYFNKLIFNNKGKRLYVSILVNDSKKNIQIDKKLFSKIKQKGCINFILYYSKNKEFYFVKKSDKKIESICKNSQFNLTIPDTLEATHRPHL